MANFEFYGYSPDALVFDAQTGQFTVDPEYTSSNGRVFFQGRDNDEFFDGDGDRDEIGEDSDQRATVEDVDGNQIASGKIYVEEFGYLQGPDGSNIMIDTIEISGEVVGYVTNAPVNPGTVYQYVQSQDVDDAGDTRLTYDYYEQNSVPCFGPGVMITTRQGEIPVEWIDTSDMVLTRDHGFQAILWVGRTKLPARYFDWFSSDRPICLPAGSLGGGLPRHDLQLTRDHRVLMRSAAVELRHLSPEVFAPAKAWVDAGLATNIQPKCDYILTHILCASHEVIMANGAWVESLFLGQETLRRLHIRDLRHISAVLGPDLNDGKTARPCLTRKEAAALLIEGNSDVARTGRIQYARSA